MKSKKKQEVIVGGMDFSNMKFNEDPKLSRPKIKEDDDLVRSITFKIHKDLVERFRSLKMEYARSSKNYNLSNNKMFVTSVHFLVDKYRNEGILKPCPQEFKDAIIKPGKRRATKRTCSFGNVDILLFKVKQSVADLYMDIMNSYIIDDPNDDIFSDHHTRTYFFYDFIDSLEKNKKDFYNYRF